MTKRSSFGPDFESSKSRHKTVAQKTDCSVSKNGEQSCNLCGINELGVAHDEIAHPYRVHGREQS